MANRTSHIKKVHRKRKRLSAEKIEKLTKGMFSFEYKLGSGKWNISKISRDTQLSRGTIYSYFRSTTGQN